MLSEKEMGQHEEQAVASSSLVVASTPEALPVSGVEHWTRRGISAASMASNIGFAAATMGTKLGVGPFPCHFDRQGGKAN